MKLVICAVGVIAALWGVAAHGADAALSARLSQDGSANRLELDLTSRVAFRVFTLDGPRRVIVDFPEIDWRLDPPRPGQAMQLIEGVRFGLVRPGASRLVIDLKRGAAVTEAFTTGGDGRAPARFVIELRPETDEAFAASAGWPDTEGAGAASTPQPQPQPQAKPKRAVVVAIDAGHGGRDSGASSGRVIEKDLVLRYAVDLAAAIEKRPGYKAFLVRQGDEFLRLRTRVERARQAGADLMISIHADALAAGVASGASVYTLSKDASDSEAAALVESHNRTDDIAGVEVAAEETDVMSVLVDLARRSTDVASVSLAEAIVTQLKARSKVLRGRALQSAGFRVLKAPDVPSVLVELGFLNSAKDRARITSDEGRAALVKALSVGIHNWVLAQTSPRYRWAQPEAAN